MCTIWPKTLAFLGAWTVLVVGLFLRVGCKGDKKPKGHRTPEPPP